MAGGTEAGILVPNERGAASMAIARLVDDPDLRARLGASARRRYEQGFSADSMWQAYLRLYMGLR